GDADRAGGGEGGRHDGGMVPGGYGRVGYFSGPWGRPAEVGVRWNRSIRVARGPTCGYIRRRFPVPYSPLLVKPMRDELTAGGVRELLSAQDVDDYMNEKEGTALLVVNSVCGCAAGMARPGIRLALEHDRRPDRLASVFAGQDLEATARARGYFADIPPSSPSIAFFKDGELVHFVPRHRIEGRDAYSVAAELKGVFDEFCATV